MEIIAIEEMRAFLKESLPNYSHPVLLFFSEVFPGCPKCNSSAKVIHVGIIEKEQLPKDNLGEILNHKFPIPIYFQHSPMQQAPSKIVLGTRKSGKNLELVIRKLI